MSSPLIIRADADSRMGTGHIMRCLALGQAWQDAGGTVIFICAKIPDSLAERVKSEGFELVRMDAESGSPDDLAQTLAAISSFKFQVSGLTSQSSSDLRPPSSGLWVVADGYHFDLVYQRAVRSTGFNLLLIDDYNHLPQYECDILLNQNINAPELHYCVNPEAKQLLGTQYALLRREFRKYNREDRTVPAQALNILVTLGGADPDNVTLKVLQALNHLNISGLHVSIVVGPANPHFESLRDAAGFSAFDVRLLTDVKDMPELMRWADLAVSAAGSTCWELCSLGVPILTVILAENQAGLAVRLEKSGASKNMGWHYQSDVVGFAGAIRNLLEHEALRTRLVCQAGHLVDGCGCNRVIKAIKGDREMK